jgi:hypothetical protein
MIGELLDAGLLHPDTQTVAGTGLAHYTKEPKLPTDGAHLGRRRARDAERQGPAPRLRPVPATGGLVELSGNLGRGVMKVSAVAPERHVIEAPARDLPRPGLGEGGVSRRTAQPRRHRRRPLPGPARQRHAGVARAHPDPRSVAGPGPQGGARHRWPHVGRLRQGPFGDPCRARGARWRADRQAARTATSSASTPRPARSPS